MLNKLKKTSNKGFTIIEVMIVLAIAGMIILVVLLAVPAVQRSGRNSAIKTDAGAVAAGISEFSTNNNGAVPTGIADNGSGVVNLTGAAGTTPTTAKVQGATKVSSIPTGTPAPTATTFTSAGEIQVWIGHSCPGAGTTSTTSTRANAIFYNTEGSSGPQLQCQDS